MRQIMTADKILFESVYLLYHAIGTGGLSMPRCFKPIALYRAV